MVYYIDDPSVDISNVSYSTTVKVPDFATKDSSYGTGNNKTTLTNGQPMFLYGVYDTSTNRRLGNEYCYVALTEDAFKDTSVNTAKITYMQAFNAEGEAYMENNNKVLIATVAASEGVSNTSLRLKKDMKNNTKYKVTMLLMILLLTRCLFIALTLLVLLMRNLFLRRTW